MFRACEIDGGPQSLELQEVVLIGNGFGNP